MAYAFLSLLGSGGDDSLLRSLIDRSITELDIPEGVTKIGGYCFLQCRDLKKITIPNTVTHIGGYALGVNALTTLEIPDSVIELGNNAIYNCSKLESITFGKGLSTIVMNNFNDLPACVTYDFSRCEQVPKMTGACFKNINAEAVILVPVALYSDWVVATNWASLLKHIWVPHSEGLEFKDDVDGTGGLQVQSIGECTDTAVVIPSEHDGRPVAAFHFFRANTVEQIYYPDSVLRVNGSCFAKNFLPNLKKLVFGAKLRTVSKLEVEENPLCTVYDFSRCEQIPKLGIAPVLNDPDAIPDGCRIIVPAGLLEEWKADTGWCVYADWIVSA